MKRSGFKRPERPERVLAPVRPITAGRFVSLADTAPVVTEKTELLRSESYRRYVAQFSCMRCGRAGPSQCAHANEGKGLAMKVCDSRTFPLCPECHEELDNSRGMTRDQRRGLEAAFVEAMQAQAIQDCRPEVATFLKISLDRDSRNDDTKGS